MILVGIGSNLPGQDGVAPLETCRWAVRRLAALPGLRLDAVSQWYVTRPMPPSGQPPYVNAVARLAVDPDAAEPDPAVLLAALHAIEAEAGRVRGEPNAARTLDLDIVAMGGMVRTAPDPVLPHPRAHLRAFVLVPLLDVAAGWIHPVEGVEAGELLRRLPDQGIRLLQR
ncbi:MAG TPA: 2-amino-4-hydroxy-6-hydroxymethyldihydropteridine diphosphokinase [Acetobacteraceae bacterium]|nr:2-amino-4-hydroxy-6-hydroxymethyldihydropteridine diphosphokinase [Acetobacteraceae bacterium]